MSNNPTKIFEIRVIFEEYATGEKQSSNAWITLHKNNIIINAATTPFQPGKLFTSNITIQKLDGSPIQDDKNYVELHFNDYVYYSLLNEKGIATFAFLLPNRIQNAYFFCKYLDVRKDLNPIHIHKFPDNNKKQQNGIELSLRTEK